MNAETGKSFSLSPFSLLGLPLQLSGWGNHMEKENVSLLPICTCKQKANHATSLCILKRSNKPTATWMPWWTRALRCPPKVQEACVPSPSRHCGAGLFLPSPGEHVPLSYPRAPALGCLWARPTSLGQSPARAGGAPPAPGDRVQPLPARPSPCFTERGGTIRRLQVTPALRP